MKIILTALAETSFNIPMGWALSGLLTLCGVVAGMGKLIFSMCLFRIRALEKEVGKLSRGCGIPGCHWKSNQNNETE